MKHTHKAERRTDQKNRPPQPPLLAAAQHAHRKSTMAAAADPDLMRSVLEGPRSTRQLRQKLREMGDDWVGWKCEEV
eukprot:6015951-Prymnesium_polylepis.1